MIGTGKNVGDLRRSNISLILKLLYFDGSQSRKVLAAKSGLTPAAVTMLTNDLMERGYIVDVEPAKPAKSGKVGRAEQFIDLNYSGLYILGLRITRKSAEIRLFTLGLECIMETITELNGDTDADRIFEILCDKIAFLMVSSNLTTDQLLGIGVTINGIVNPADGISINSFGSIANNTNVREQIQKRLNLPVSVNNNVRSMLLAEAAVKHESQGVSHLFIKYGPGVGGAFSTNQTSYNGATYRAMEIGHVVVDPEGELCRCGRRGCLETVLSYQTLFTQAESLAENGHAPILKEEMRKNGDICLEALATACDLGETVVCDLVAEKYGLFARLIEEYITILDPQSVSICSDSFRHESLHRLFEQHIEKNCPSAKDRLVFNPESDRIEQVGAAALVIHSFLAGESAQL